MPALWLLAFSAAVAIAVLFLREIALHYHEPQELADRLFFAVYAGAGELLSLGLAATFFMAFLDTSGWVPINF